MSADRCAACGRRLRLPSPSGLGPVCARRLGVPVARPSARRAIRRATNSRSDAAGEQIELPITDEPTLWSL